MTLLPVVEREFRVAARERNTYRVRFLSAFLPVLFSGFSLWFVKVFMGSNPIPARDLFMALIWIEFAFVVMAGFSLTCDSISQEKRDATLGLLFLTDLKGYDIVLGKLAVAAVRGLYALLATVPVLALPLMMGGTNLAELAQTTFALIITLFFSMAVGLVLSSVLRRGWAALGLSAFILLLFALVLPLYSQFVRRFFREPFLAHLIELPSPSYALIMSFSSAIGLRGNGHAVSIGLISGLALLALILASFITPRVWKDRPPQRRVAALLQWLRDLKFGAEAARRRFRRRLLDLNPVYWLSRRERVSSLGLMLVLLGAGGIAWWFGTRDWSRLPWEAQSVIPFVAWMFCGVFMHVAIVLRLPVVAAERFGEDRRSGALELLLSTPFSIKDLLAGHWMALRRYFAGPCAMAIGTQFLAFTFFLGIQPVFGEASVTISEIFGDIWDHISSRRGMDPHRWFRHYVVLIMLGLFPVLILNWIALGWLSTWFSLRLKNTLGVPIVSIILLLVPPWAIHAIIAVALEDWHMVPSHDFTEALMHSAIASFLVISHQLFCIWWSRRQLYRHFRTAATDRYQPASPRRWWHWRIA